uniref:BglG family transcription antiterminator n=1 Tax=Agathobacter sp. TaxID=2021311 RepID=UPI004056EA20
MHEKQLLMIKTLAQSSKSVSAKNLAAQLGVSPRTVLNYINDINGLSSEPMIVATSTGYIIEHSKASELLEKVNRIPEGYKERSFYICKQLLMGTTKQLDAFELSDELCISYSLLKNDLQKMNQSYAYLNIKFAIKNNQVLLIGSERNKRKLMNHVLTQAQESNLLDITTLKQYFPENIVDDSLFILENLHEENGYYLNDFSKINLLLHMLTMVVRILNGNWTSLEYEKNLDSDIPQDMDSNLADQLCNKLEEHFHIEVRHADRLQFYLLIKSHSNLVSCKTEENFTQYIGKELLEIIEKIIQSTEKQFCIRLSNQEFLVRFALHISNMRFRILNQVETTNPLKASLRSTSPFLYDIAIYIIQQLRKEELICDQISEDEISFIVLHIGAEIERQYISDNKIHCILFVPEYLDISQTIVHKLLLRFDDQITIKQTLTLNESQINSSCDLVISVVNNQSISKCRHVYVSPFLTSTDYNAINDAIEQIQTQKSFNYLKNNFDYYFSEKNFLINYSENLERDTVINALCDLLVQQNYVTEQYQEHVFKRENAASTAYNDFAIPHSVCMESSINTIGVLIAPNGIRWNGHQVYVVFMMAISSDSLNDFQTLYNILAQLLTNTEISKALRKSKSFEEFKKHILSPELF